MFKVDHLLWVFAFVVKQLLKTADTMELRAQEAQDGIDILSARKKAALDEQSRALKIADKIGELIS